MFLSASYSSHKRARFHHRRLGPTVSYLLFFYSTFIDVFVRGLVTLNTMCSALPSPGYCASDLPLGRLTFLAITHLPF